MVANRGTAQFPDSISPRATEHLRALTKIATQGQRAYLLFVIQRGDAKEMEINRERDLSFTHALQRATAAGVQLLAMKCQVTVAGFRVPTIVPIVFERR